MRRLSTKGGGVVTARDQQRMREVIAQVALKPCTWCGESADGNVAAFFPYDSAAYGSPPGKRRAIFYSLCRHCWATTTNEQREARMDAWGWGRVA
jgi:hypothetical protein